MAVLLTSDLSANLSTYYYKKALSVLEPRLQLYKLAKKAPLPKNSGKSVKWILWSAVAGSSSALTEGTNPSEIAQTTANVSATIAQYGQFSKFSDLLVMTAIDPIIESASERFGHAARKSIEALIAAELDGALTVRRANGISADNSVTAADTLTMKDFIKAMIALKQAYVGPHESGKYVSVLHPSTEYDLLAEENMHGVLSVRQDALKSEKDVMAGEVGSLFGMRFVVSDSMNAADNASSVSLKRNYVIGEECFGCVDITSSPEGFQLIVKNPNANDTSNPLNMFSTCGYKIGGFVAKNFAAARGILLKGATSYA